MIKGLVRIPNGSDVSCVDIFLCAKGFDSPSNTGEGIWPKRVSKKKGRGSYDGLTRLRLGYLHYLG